MWKHEMKWNILFNISFNDALNTFYLWLYGVGHMVKDHSDSERQETRCRHMGYSFRKAARVLLYAPSHRQESTYHSLCYSSRGALAGTRNSSMGPPHEGSIQRPIAPWANALTTELHLAPQVQWLQCENTCVMQSSAIINVLNELGCAAVDAGLRGMVNTSYYIASGVVNVIIEVSESKLENMCTWFIIHIKSL